MTNGASSCDKRVLLVEGPDDKAVVHHLCSFGSQMPTFCIRSKEGIDNLLRGIRGEILAEGRTAVGIVVDGNDDLKARWQAVTDKIRSANINPPTNPEPGGTIIDGSPRVGIWLMPDNESPGELEGFVAKMIPCNDEVWPLSKAYVDGIPIANRRFAERKALKAKVHSWLATREYPRLMGSAIRAGDLNVDVGVSKKFMRWLRELFN